MTWLLIFYALNGNAMTSTEFKTREECQQARTVLVDRAFNKEQAEKSLICFPKKS